VDLRSTKGVIKNIIPAIASTNAVIAAACSNEAFKFATNASGFLNNYMMYIGGDGLYTLTFEYEKKENCTACGTPEIKWDVDPKTTWEDFIERLAKDPALQLVNPSITCADNKVSIYMQKPPMMEKKLRPNLKLTLGELIGDGMYLNITAPALLSIAIQIQVHFVGAKHE